MHVGKAAPYDLTTRVYMGPFAYPGWARKQYTLTVLGGSLVGPLAGEMNYSNWPVLVERDPSREASLLYLCYAGFVQATSAGDLYAGWILELQSNRSQVKMMPQFWVGSTLSYSFANVGVGNPLDLNAWTTSGPVHEPAAKIWLGAPMTIASVPW